MAEASFNSTRLMTALAAGASTARAALGLGSAATTNSVDLLSRSNHSGTQPATTVTGLAAIATSGSATDLAGTIAAARLPAMTGGDVTSPAGSTVLTIGNGTVSYAKLQAVGASNRILGRGDSGAGQVQELTIGTGLSLTGTTLSATGSSGGWAEKTLASDFTTSVATFSTVTDGSTPLSFTPPASSPFEIEAVLLIQTATATNLPRIGVNVGAQGSGAYGSIQIDQTGATVTTRVVQDGTFGSAAKDVQVPAGGLPTANEPYLCYVSIRGRAGASPAPINIQMGCETAAANTCFVKAGSQLRMKAS